MPPSRSLPLPLSSFIGREHELAELKSLLATTRLLTVSGPGGAGKTRLALELARELTGGFPGGVGWAELADVVDPTLVPQVVAASLALREQLGRALMDTLIDTLRSDTALLILDNCEHLLAPCASLTDALLRACPALTILATSREPLRVVGENLWTVPPLAVPAPRQPEGDDEGLTAAHVGQYEAVRLFVARAAAILPGFHLSDQNAAPIAHLCRQLDGLPLAIELAAARVRLLSVADIAARLDRALGLLTRGSVTVSPRHQTLRAVIDWSYVLLSSAEQTLLQRLSVFAGGFSLDAAEGVCAGAGLETADILDTLADLVDRSLVVVTALADGSQNSARYRLLEIIRQYAREKLQESGEADVILDRHLAWYLALAERAVPELRGPRHAQWLRLLDEEHDNMRAALRWSQTGHRVEQGLRLAAALHWYWERRGDFSEGRAWLNAALQQIDAADQSETMRHARADALLGAATLAFGQSDGASAATYAQESAQLFRELHDKPGLTLALLRLGFAVGPTGEQGRAALEEASRLAETVEDRWVVGVVRYVVGQAAYFSGDYATARVSLETALRLIRAVGDILLLPRVLATLGGMDLGLGDYGQARARLEEALALVREANDPRALALVAGGLGDVARCQGDYVRAAEVYNESLAIYRRLGNRADIPALLHNLGYVALGQGDVDAAHALFVESLIEQRDRANLAGVAEGLAGLAAVAGARGELERAAQLFGATEALREQIRPMLWPAERFEWERHVAALRGRLDASSLASAWAAGRGMTVEEATAYALAAPATGPEASGTRQSAQAAHPAESAAEKLSYGGLTAREREVAALIARGKSNRAIAEELVIAERTAERHVANILAKLDFNSRAQVAAWAVETGLAKPE